MQYNFTVQTKKPENQRNIWFFFSYSSETINTESIDWQILFFFSWSNKRRFFFSPNHSRFDVFVFLFVLNLLTFNCMIRDLYELSREFYLNKIVHFMKRYNLEKWKCFKRLKIDRKKSFDWKNAILTGWSRCIVCE